MCLAQGGLAWAGRRCPPDVALHRAQHACSQREPLELSGFAKQPIPAPHSGTLDLNPSLIFSLKPRSSRRSASSCAIQKP